MSESLTLADEAATAALGARLAQALAAQLGAGFCLWLEGELGAGKTTLVRGILRALGHAGRVPSPSYTLVEPYEVSQCEIYHIDLYRISSATEADFLGLAELPGPGRLLLIEWPAQGAERTPPADLRVQLAVAGSGRQAWLVPLSPAGEAALTAISSKDL